MTFALKYDISMASLSDTLPIKAMSYSEAIEMSYFGAKVIYPPTMLPAQEKNIPILIKNTFEPEAEGTVIGKKTAMDGTLARGISSICDVAVLRLEGSGILRARGASGRLFGALARARVNIILIMQASSQNSISFALAARDVERAARAIN